MVATVVLLLGLAVTRGAASQPASLTPEETRAAELQGQLDEAQRELKVATDARLGALAANPAYQKAVADLNSSREALASARQQSDIAVRVKAMNDAGAARAEVEKMKEGALTADVRVVSARGRVAALTKELDAASDAAMRAARDRVEREKEAARDAAAMAITINQLVAGDKQALRGRVKLVAEFSSIDNYGINLLPGVVDLSRSRAVEVNPYTQSLSGAGTVDLSTAPKGKSDVKDWLEIRVVSGRDSAELIFGVRNEIGHSVGSLKRGDQVEMFGTVIELKSPGKYGLVLDKIRKVPGS